MLSVSGTMTRFRRAKLSCDGDRHDLEIATRGENKNPR